MGRKRKRRLTKEEIAEVRKWMEEAPPGNKPNVRQIAKRYGVNQPSVVKSLGGWKGVHRGKPQPPPRSKFDLLPGEGIKKPKIEAATFVDNEGIPSL